MRKKNGLIMVHRAMLKPKLTTIFDRSANPLNATMEPLKKQNGVYAENATCMEAYSVAGKTWFGCWLVEHYFSYHVDCPDGCGLGEPARGR